MERGYSINALCLSRFFEEKGGPPARFELAPKDPQSRMLPGYTMAVSFLPLYIGNKRLLKSLLVQNRREERVMVELDVVVEHCEELKPFYVLFKLAP